MAKTNLKSDTPAVEKYLAKLGSADRVALQELRMKIKELLPDSEERISFGGVVVSMGKDVIGYAAAKKHLSLYTMSSGLIRRMRNDILPFEAVGSAIHFSPKEMLPEVLLKKIIGERLMEIEHPEIYS